MRLVIIESPFAGEVEENIKYARLCVHDSIHQGEAPIASHLLYTQPGVLDDLIPGERALGIAAGLEWRRVADYSVFYTDRGWSSGMLAALESGLQQERGFCVRSLVGIVRHPAILDETLQELYNTLRKG